MTQGPPPPVPAAAATLNIDTPCRKCGYNLRGLSPAGRCPECGAVIAISIGGDTLRYSNPAWLAKLAMGADLLAFGGTFVFPTSLCFGIGGVPLPLSAVYAVGTLILFAVGLLSIVAGVWLVTQRELSGLLVNNYGPSRQIIRVTLIIALASSVPGLFKQFFTLNPGGSLILHSMEVAAAVAIVIGLPAQLDYFSKLARRIPDASLTARANFLKIALPVTCGLLFAPVILAAYIQPAGPMPGAGLSLVAAIAIFVFLIMYLFLVARLAISFKEQSHAARQMWDRANPNPSV